MGEGRDRRRAVTAAAMAVVIAMSALAACARGGSTAGEPAASTTEAAGTTSVTDPSAGSSTSATPSLAPTEVLLSGLVVRTSDPAAPYVRDLMDGGDWDYDPATGCNTRELVLIDESIIEPQVDAKCRTTLGRWRSPYDGVETDDKADLQIDHLVPLADAWRSGASGWTPERRLAFANDRTSPDTLVAVTGSLNQSKGDATPDEWLPPDETAWCSYAEAWVRVKAAWGLSVTTPERDRLRDLLAAC